MKADVVLILGSAPDVLRCRDWPRPPWDAIVAINNAVRVRTDWTHHIHPEDYDPHSMPAPASPDQTVVTAADYVPVQNRYGGFVYAGGTMSMTAGYWALGALSPRVIAYLGCDMVYDRPGATHFYGTGTPDPLREDISLRSLEAKAARLMILAARQGCAVVNLSDGESRLVFPRRSRTDAADAEPIRWSENRADEALAREDALDYRVPSGRYWEVADRFAPAEIDALDSLWLRAARLS